jgi:hypothetical protein
MIAVLRTKPDQRWSSAALLLVAALALNLASGVRADTRDQAKRIHDRIAGVSPDATTLDLMQNIMQTDPIDGPYSAALLATDNPSFYNVTLKYFVAPWTNRDQAVFVPLNDYTATVIGMVRDDIDFRQILFGDILYVGSGPGVPPYSISNNDNYEALDDQAADLSNPSVLKATLQSVVTGLPPAATAGVITSRAAARAFFIAGTNRAMFRFTMLNQLCRDMEQVHDISRAPDRIRQDVSRSPGGDSRVFLNNCIGCHSGMDPMAQAFAYYNFQYDKANDPDAAAGFLAYNSAGDSDPVTGTRVVAKYFNNNLTFPYGYVTLDDHWDNYWRNGPDAVLGWDGSLPGTGDGAKSLGEELANSQAFAQCQVEKVFKNVCLRAPSDQADRDAVAGMVGAFQTDYNLRNVFARSAVYCMGE